MTGDRYIINDQNATYFCTLTVTDWVDIFTRQVYRDIIVDSLNFCVQHKGLTIYSWVLMSNHLHLILSIAYPFRCSDFLRDFKKFTSKAIAEEVNNLTESRRTWLLDLFHFEAKRTHRANNYKVWRDSNHAIILDGTIDIWQKIHYIHENPVKNGLVTISSHYCYSSARDYNDDKGPVNVVVVK